MKELLKLVQQDNQSVKLKDNIKSDRLKEISFSQADFMAGKHYGMSSRPSLPHLCVTVLPQIYIHIPGSEKLVLELPLVIGTAGLGSRSSSVSSQEGSVGDRKSVV